MKSTKRLILLGVVLSVSVIGLAFAKANDDSDGLHLKADVTATGGSGITGTAVINIGEDGLTGKLRVDNLKRGHGYTTWIFYCEGPCPTTNPAIQGGPGRFDSIVAEDDDGIFRGHVGGLKVSSGSTVLFFIFDHPVLDGNVSRANNLLTPMGGSKVAQAVFTIP